MPTFEIPDGPTTVELKRSGDAANPGPATGSAIFTVTNTSGDSCLGRLGVVASGNSKAEWFAVDGDRERTFAPGESQTATIRVAAPRDAAAGDYPFRLRVVAVNDPDNDHAEGPVATAKVPPPEVVVGKRPMWWLWILIALVVLAALAAAAYFILRNPKPDEPAGNVVVAPPPPAPPTAHMGPLELGFDRPGIDIAMGKTVANVRACAKLCEDTDQCLAMTYVFVGAGNTQNGTCWIKNGIPHRVPNGLMISAVKEQ